MKIDWVSDFLYIPEVDNTQLCIVWQFKVDRPGKLSLNDEYADEFIACPSALQNWVSHDM